MIDWITARDADALTHIALMVFSTKGWLSYRKQDRDRLLGILEKKNAKLIAKAVIDKDMSNPQAKYLFDWVEDIRLRAVEREEKEFAEYQRLKRKFEGRAK